VIDAAEQFPRTGVKRNINLIFDTEFYRSQRDGQGIVAKIRIIHAGRQPQLVVTLGRKDEIAVPKIQTCTIGGAADFDDNNRPPRPLTGIRIEPGRQSKLTAGEVDGVVDDTRTSSRVVRQGCLVIQSRDNLTRPGICYGPAHRQDRHHLPLDEFYAFHSNLSCFVVFSYFRLAFSVQAPLPRAWAADLFISSLFRKLRLIFYPLAPRRITLFPSVQLSR